MVKSSKQITSHACPPAVWRESQVTVIIMAGGEGTRFYPLSTPDRPKQFLNFIGDKTFIRQTFERILPLVSSERIYISTNERYVRTVKEQLPEVPVENIIGEPCKKNTAPALVYATALIKERHGDVTICCFPSDHYIADEDGFRKIIARACGLADDGYLVTLGMKPTWTSTEYGYISPCHSREPVIPHNPVIPAAVGGDLPHPIAWSKVSHFTEKPKKELAEEYVKKGYLWNGGIFVWKASVLLGEVAKYSPELLLSTSHKSQVTSHETSRAYFENVNSISIDYAIMEKSDKVAVIPTDIGWSDVGGWESVERLISEGVNIAPHVCAAMKGDGPGPACPPNRII